mgnify:CR=1 FL=1
MFYTGVTRKRDTFIFLAKACQSAYIGARLKQDTSTFPNLKRARHADWSTYEKRTAAAVFLLAACVLAFIPKTQAQAKEPVIVVIDPGHGGEQNRGGEVLPQYVEKNLTLQVAQSMKQTLEQFEGVQVYLTRTNDQELSLEQRAQIAKACNAEFFVFPFILICQESIICTERRSGPPPLVNIFRRARPSAACSWLRCPNMDSMPKG